ncbi:MAG TPA: thermopsin [Nitrososphaerales archaeon]|nr:thermopsin [Nitrososphaerales archaeon]
MKAAIFIVFILLTGLVGPLHLVSSQSPPQHLQAGSQLQRGRDENYTNYTVEPAPMGIADYGVGPKGDYQYATTSFIGIADVQSLTVKNGTGDPSMTFQLNVNLQILLGGGRTSHIWIQNTADLDTASRTVMMGADVWNQSSSIASLSDSTVSGAGYLVPCGCSEGGPADYESYAPSSQPGGDGSYSLPMQMELEVNASTNSNGTPTVTFSYQDGFGWQTYDTLSFIAYSRVSPADVSFVVNGARFNPDGSFENAELILGGEYNGLNTTAVASEVGLQLQFWNGHNYQEVYNAYNFGGDTAEGIDNVKVGTSAAPNGSLGAEVTTGSGTLGRLYSQSQVSFLAVSVPFESGVMYVRNSSSSQEPTGIYPFRGDSVNVTLLPGTYVANLISSDGILTKNLTETLRAGQALQVNVTSVTTTSTSVSSSQRTSTSSFTSLQTSSASSTSSTQATATESSSSPQGNQLELVGVTLVVVVAVAALYFMAAKRRGGRPQPPA